tara:strand:+ start:346 stop:954 length:609 start_codon:yes stop_codon:yes gene_type:complete
MEAKTTNLIRYIIMIQKVKINQIFTNPNNPRLIRDDKFKKLVKSIIEFPEMLKLRPIVVDEKNIILGGNMRYKACQQIGLKEVYVIKAENLTDKQLQQFVIKDNVGFGEWDWDILANGWDTVELKDWGIDVWQPEEEIDYSVLDEIDLEEQIETMYDQTKKSIILEFPAKGFEPIKELYESLKTKNVNLPDLFYKAMKKYDS